MSSILGVYTFSKKYRYVLMVVLSLTIVAVAVVAYRPAITNQLDDWKLLPRPERLTELYFTEHTKLAKTYLPGQQQTIAFTIHNIEYRATTYQYAVVQQDVDGKQSAVLAQGDYTLGHDMSYAVRVPVALQHVGVRSKVTVQLTYNGIAFGDDLPTPQQQSIHYYLTLTGETNVQP